MAASPTKPICDTFERVRTHAQRNTNPANEHGPWDEIRRAIRLEVCEHTIIPFNGTFNEIPCAHADEDHWRRQHKVYDHNDNGDVPLGRGIDHIWDDTRRRRQARLKIRIRCCISHLRYLKLSKAGGGT